MSDEFLRRLRERLDPSHAEELARLYYEACNPQPPVKWEDLPLEKRADLTEAMRALLRNLSDEKPHLWTIRHDVIVCERCGIARRDGKNSPCTGKLPSVLPR